MKKMIIMAAVLVAGAFALLGYELTKTAETPKRTLLSICLIYCLFIHPNVF